MRKGTLGISLPFLASLAFILVFFEQSVALALLCGLALAAERDDWLTRQCLQALGLNFMFIVANWIEHMFSGFTSGLFGALAGPVLTGIAQVLSFIVWLPAVIFWVMGLTRVGKGEEARLPIFATWAAKATGFVQQMAPPAQGGYPPQGGYTPQTQPGGYPQPQAQPGGYPAPDAYPQPGAYPQQNVQQPAAPMGQPPQQ